MPSSLLKVPTDAYRRDYVIDRYRTVMWCDVMADAYLWPESLISGKETFAVSGFALNNMLEAGGHCYSDLETEMKRRNGSPQPHMHMYV